MVVGGSQQETLDPGFVLFGTRQQGVPVILRELVLPGGFDHYVYIVVHQGSWYLCGCATELSCTVQIVALKPVRCLVPLLNGVELYCLGFYVKVRMVSGSPENQCKITLAHKGILYYCEPPNALVRPRVGRVPSPSRNTLTRPRVYSLCQGSPTHCLLVAGVLFTKMRGRKANVRRFNRITKQWCTWAPVSCGNKWRMNQSLVTGYHGIASHDVPLPCGLDH
ncbi:unnamed protein product [Schistosoma margrebowiei]|uniref:Uncharacterized protein n=1 Tax=Schistosoma margrebowiei TaxID=48269 RepID=A0A183N9X0_9TREM|nr:unnamed protein product [Schistosoma margrebowiei]